MKIIKYVMYNDLNVYVKLHRSMQRFIPIYKIYKNKVSSEMVMSNKDLDVDKVKFVNLKIPTGYMKYISIADIDKYCISVTEYNDRGYDGSVDTTILEMSFTNFETLMIKCDNNYGEPLNPYRIESLLWVTTYYESIELLDKNKRHICYVIQPC